MDFPLCLVLPDGTARDFLGGGEVCGPIVV